MSEEEQRAPRDDALPLSPMLKVVVLPDDAAGVMQELITMVDRLEMGEDDDCTSDLEGVDAAKSADGDVGASREARPTSSPSPA